MNRYYKNFILCGDINQYCLLCKESFHLILDIEKHVRWEKHRKSVKEQSCLRQLQTDLIYKIQNNYYCEICNLVMKNMGDVKEHIKTDKHELLKKQPDAIIKKPAGQVKAGFVIIDNVVMNRLEWHSIIDNICNLCTVEIGNVEEHIASEEHMIKLIQSQTKYADNQYYRKLDEDRYHCLACKKIFALTNFVEHWVDCENNEDKEIKKHREAHCADSGEGSSRMADLERELIETLKAYYTVDEVTNIARCKKCQKCTPVDFRAMMEHMKDSHSGRRSDSTSESSEEEVVDTVIRDSGLRRFELAEYGKKKYIKMNYNGSKGYCKFCDKYISPSKFQFKLHCLGITHQGYLEIVGLKTPKLRETSMTYTWKRFSSYVISIQNSVSESSFWINSQYCVDVYSFFFLHPIRGDPHYKLVKCHACIQVMYQDEVLAHTNSMKHRVLFSAAKILEIGGEFIREVRPFLYHCGFCNLTFPYSKVLEKHLRTKKHNVLREKNTLASQVVQFIRNFDTNPINVSENDDELYTQLMQIAGDFVSTPN